MSRCIGARRMSRCIGCGLIPCAYRASAITQFIYRYDDGCGASKGQASDGSGRVGCDRPSAAADSAATDHRQRQSRLRQTIGSGRFGCDRPHGQDKEKMRTREDAENSFAGMLEIRNSRNAINPHLIRRKLIRWRLMAAQRR